MVTETLGVSLCNLSDFSNLNTSGLLASTLRNSLNVHEIEGLDEEHAKSDVCSASPGTSLKTLTKSREQNYLEVFGNARDLHHKTSIGTRGQPYIDSLTLFAFVGSISCLEALKHFTKVVNGVRREKYSKRQKIASTGFYGLRLIKDLALL